MVALFVWMKQERVDPGKVSAQAHVVVVEVAVAVILEDPGGEAVVTHETLKVVEATATRDTATGVMVVTEASEVETGALVVAAAVAEEDTGVEDTPIATEKIGHPEMKEMTAMNEQTGITWSPQRRCAALNGSSNAIDQALWHFTNQPQSCLVFSKGHHPPFNTLFKPSGLAGAHRRNPAKDEVNLLGSRVQSTLAR
ncbi:uncharacterized protein LOC131469788 isoform X2 [Solea solea]|uniref:uncharacterized protein LOC131469788 isoform X2 n=1 Tax=Solea solea TaxID=90069 RepID=UPI00272B06AD|nr:uncharacterized protein LOC131469788 isoform X2 [Solea solea]